MKHDYRILENMPYEHIQKFWERDGKILNTDLFDHTDYMVEKTWQCITLNKEHELHKIIKDMFEPLGLEVGLLLYMICDARLGMDKIHEDKDWRGSAINIPIQIEEEQQFFLMGSEECTPAPRSPSGAPKFLYEPEKCAFYNARRPYMFNSRKPHGFANYADTERVVLSISFQNLFDDALKLIPKEWF